MFTLGERLQSAMNSRGVTVSRLAKAVGMTYQGVKKIVDGKTREMSGSKLLAISAYLSINAEWLRSGRGERDISKTPTPPRTLSETQWDFLDDFEMLPEDERQALRATLRAKADNVRRIVAEMLGRHGAKATGRPAKTPKH